MTHRRDHRKHAEGVRARARAPEVRGIPGDRAVSRRGASAPIFAAGAARFWFRLVLLATVVVVPNACTEASARPALANARGSAEALVTAALEAIEAEDEEALKGLLITREEYETLLWPEMPDGEYTPFDFVWSLAETNNQKGRKQALSAFGGVPLELVSISFAEEPEVYQSFKLHPGVEVMVRRPDTGEQGLHPSFDVLIEYGGQWKFLNLDEL